MSGDFHAAAVWCCERIGLSHGNGEWYRNHEVSSSVLRWQEAAGEIVGAFIREELGNWVEYYDDEDEDEA
jgi:hypothetical protein